MKTKDRAYKTMSGAGAGSIVIGVIILVSGVTAGVLSIINGARLLKDRSDVLF